VRAGRSGLVPANGRRRRHHGHGGHNDATTTSFTHTLIIIIVVVVVVVVVKTWRRNDLVRLSAVMLSVVCQVVASGLTIKWSPVRSPARRGSATTLGKSFTPICLDADSRRYYTESLNKAPLPFYLSSSSSSRTFPRLERVCLHQLPACTYNSLELVVRQCTDQYSLQAGGLIRLSAAMLSLVYQVDAPSPSVVHTHTHTFNTH